MVCTTINAKTSLVYAVNPSSVAQQEIYYLLAQKFEQTNPEIKIKIVSRELEDHKNRINQFIADGEYFADVIMAYAGTQLHGMHKSQRLLPLNQFWQQYQLEQQFSANSKQVVSIGGQVMALPLNYYQWGIYYKKSLLKQAGLVPPTTWQELLVAIKELKKQGVVPFSLSGASNWSLAAWFDYLNLRLNGLDFHQRLLRGEINFHDTRVANIFSHWKQLIEIGAFDLSHLKLNWQQSLPYLYRNHVAMSLLGNFFVAHIPEKRKSEFGFVAFPTIKSQIPRFEDVPFDVAVIDKNTQQANWAKRFLAFLSRPDTQTLFSNYVGKISPNLQATGSNNDFVKQGKRHIESAAGLAQFFDRDTSQAFAQGAQKLFYQFMQQPSQQAIIIDGLESLRLKHLVGNHRSQLAQ